MDFGKVIAHGTRAQVRDSPLVRDAYLGAVSPDQPVDGGVRDQRAGPVVV